MAILDEAFAGIDQAIANTEKNIQNAQELFESYLNNIFTQKGEGWKKRNLEECAKFSGGGTPSKSRNEFWGGNIPWVSPKDMKSALITKTQDYITNDAINGSSAKLVSSGALLIVVRSGILARKIPIAIAGVDLTVNQDLKVLMPISGILPEFLFFALTAQKQVLLKKVTKGATVHRIQSDALRNVEIGYPSLKEQEFIINLVRSLETETDNLIVNYQDKLTALKELKQSLLQKAFAGELTSDMREAA